MEQQRKSKRARWIGIGLGGATLLLGGAYVAAYFVAGNQMPAHASVQHVPIGGMTPADAEAKLREALGPKYEAPMTITSPAAEAQLLPAESGLAIDYAATIHRAGGGFSWNPVTIYHSFMGGHDVDPAFDIDEDALHEAVVATQPTFAKAPSDASIELVDGQPKFTEAVEGASLKADETADALKDAFKQGLDGTAAVLETLEPSVSNAPIEAFRDGALHDALAGAVSLTSPNGNIDLPEEQIGSLLTIAGTAPDLRVEVNPQAVEEATSTRIEELNANGPKPASYRLGGNGIEVVPGKNGTIVDEEHVLAAFQQAVGGGERTVAIETIDGKPAFDTAAAEQVRPTEVIGEFTTYFPQSQYRDVNIGEATRRINGTVLLPGETFSFNGTVGERTEAAGFVAGYAINNGNMVKEVGGGVSQVATTLFNAAFFAGLEDVEHHPHTLYFSRYPAGREATVYWGQLDLQFRNNTDYPLVIQGYRQPSMESGQGSVNFKIWSRKTWDKVESTELVKSDYYNGTERVSHADNCEPQAPQQGFSVNYKRLFYRGGVVAKEEPFFWKYSAGDRITCA